MKNEWVSITIEKPDGTTEKTSDYMRVLHYIADDICEAETIHAIRRALEKYSIFQLEDLNDNESICELTMEMFNQIGAERKSCLMNMLHSTIEKKADEIVAKYDNQFKDAMRMYNANLKDPFDALILSEMRKVVEFVSDLKDSDCAAMTDIVFAQLADQIRKILNYNQYQKNKKTVCETVLLYRDEIEDIVKSKIVSDNPDNPEKLYEIKKENGETVVLNSREIIREIMRLYQAKQKDNCKLNIGVYLLDIEIYLAKYLEDILIDYYLGDKFGEDQIKSFIAKIIETFGDKMIDNLSRLEDEYGYYDEIIYDVVDPFAGPIRGLYEEFRENCF